MGSAAYVVGSWSDFATAGVESAAALTGLIFVAVSVNVSRIIAVDRELGAAHLAGRTLEAVSQLLVILVVSDLLLVPAQPVAVLGLELILGGLAATVVPVRGYLARSRGGVSPPGHQAWHHLRTATAWGAPFALLLAGGTLLAHAGGGLYWIVPAFLIGVIGAVANAWVLLIEIVR